MVRATSLGVIVARLHVDDLHEGHLDLFKEVQDTHSAILVVIGLSPLKCTINNPLDFDTRRRMLLDHFPDAKVAYVNDHRSDEVWSESLDAVVAKYGKHFDNVIMYGSRDSFIKYYSGKYVTEELAQRVYVSGTAIRNQIATRSRNTADFRAGAIWYALNQYPQSIPTVDIAIISPERNEILLARKHTETQFRLVGGFVQPGETYETAASRELQEETGLFVNPECLVIEKSFVIDDWRYKNETNKITTMLYTALSWNGKPAPDDDIFELQWFKISNWASEQIVPEHLEMFHYLTAKYGSKQ